LATRLRRSETDGCIFEGGEVCADGIGVIFDWRDTTWGDRNKPIASELSERENERKREEERGRERALWLAG